MDRRTLLDRFVGDSPTTLAGFVLTCAVLLAGVWVTDRNTRRLADASHRAGQAQQVAVGLDAVLLALVDAETGERGFVLTGREEFLEPYRDAGPRVREQVTLLDRLADTSPAFRDRVADVERRAAAVTATWEAAIALRRADLNPARAVDLAGRGKTEMDAVRRAVADAKAEVRTAARGREDEEQAILDQNLVTNLLTGALGLVLVAAAFVLVYRHAGFERRARRTVGLERERLRVTLTSIGDGLLTTDAEGRVTGLNPVAEDLTGWALDAAVGQPMDDVFRVIDEVTRRPIANPARRVLAGESATGLGAQAVLIARDGTERPVDDSAAPIRADNGAVVGAVLVFRDVTARRRSEDALRASEARKAAVLDTALDAIITIDEAGHVVEFNPAAERMFGRPRAGVVGLDMGELIVPPRLREAHRNGMANYLLTGDGPVLGQRLELAAVRADGTEFPVEVAIMRIPAPGPALFTGHIRDITDRKRAEEQLRESEERLRTTFQTVKDYAIVATDAAGTVTGWNAGAERVFGWPAAEIVGRPAELLFTAEDRAAGVPAQELYAAAKTGHGEDERWHVRKDGTQFYASGVVTPVRAANGELRGFTKVARDETEWKRAEEADRRRSDQLRRLAAVAAQVNVATDVRSVVGVVTDEARGLVGAHQAATLLTRAEGPGVNAVSFSDKYGRWHGYKPMPGGEDIYSMVHSFGLPIRVTAAELEGHPGWAEFATAAFGRPPLRGLLAAPLVGRDGSTVGVIELSDKDGGDFTEDDENVLMQLATIASVAFDNARLLEQLVDADRRKDEFLAMLAHELRNPLAPIRNAAAIMRQAADKPAVVERARSVIDRQLQQMVRLVDDLLDVSRVSSGKITLQTQPVAVGPVVAAAVEMARPLMESSGHTLTIDVPADPIPLSADPARLTQVVGNLLTNAAKFTDRGGRVSLTVRRVGDAAVIAVKDTGVGLRADMRTRIFDLFAQADTTLERSRGGLGIGLTLVKRLVEMHGGTVEAHSDGPGKGSEFVVRLPVAAAVPAPVAPATPDASPAAGAALRVVVADDNADSAATLSDMLRLLGHDVTTVADGEAAVAAAEAVRPDVIVSDIGMPRLNGYEVARQVRSRPWGGGVFLVALTGWGQADDRAKSAAAGFDHHLVKPVDPDALGRLLAGVTPRPNVAV